MKRKRKVEGLERGWRCRIYPSQEQRKTLQKWMGASRFLYNKMVAHINDETRTEEVDALAMKRELSCAKNPFIKEMHPWLKDTPSHTRQQAIVEAARAFSNGRKAVKEGRIQHFELKFRKKKSNVQSCYIDAVHVKRQDGEKEINIYGSKLGVMKMKGKRGFPPGGLPTRIVSHRGRFFMIVVLEKKQKEARVEGSSGGENQTPFSISKATRVCSIDPGVRSFLTYYDPDGKAGELVVKAKNSGVDRLFKLTNFARYLFRLAKAEQTGKKQRYRLRRKARKLLRRSQTLKDEMHRRLIAWLVTNYDVILLPHYETQQMMKKKGRSGKQRKIQARTVREMSLLSFYQFSQRLKANAEENGVTIIRVNEACTSKTCGNCGTLKDVGGSKTFTCKECHERIDRDLNGARNILLRYFVKLGL